MLQKPRQESGAPNFILRGPWGPKINYFSNIFYFFQILEKPIFKRVLKTAKF